MKPDRFLDLRINITDIARGFDSLKLAAFVEWVNLYLFIEASVERDGDETFLILRLPSEQLATAQDIYGRWSV